MENSVDTNFPKEFGASPDEFLQQYESLIYKVIYERTREDSRFEAEDLFHEFFIHIAEDHFRRLRCYRGECQPTTYLGKMLRNFICDQYRKKGFKTSPDSLEAMVEKKGETIPAPVSYPEDALTSELIQDALRETFSKLSNREKLMFDLSFNEEMPAKEIANLLGVKVKSVYKNNEKIKRILKDALKKREIENF